ncbi:cation-translocating P-type ATPase [Herbaspirillum sp. RV1423]|uniref:cation-translocating P-type ATPase n=1 Tax=Herbaspirillum sp. RV1423 TaxID=1443993 RepID=UPI0004ADBE82|nr:cation-translocating P-type ATPase [Herbaspirillum sp. RV1423]
MTDSSPASQGLSDAEVAARLARDGLNQLPKDRQGEWLIALRELFAEPMFLLLIACCAVYLMLGNRQEAFMLAGFIVIVMGISFYQNRRAERSLQALRDLSSPQALVIRNGRPVRVAGSELVCGDIVLLSEGDRIPADMRLLDMTQLMVDESMLTGESVPVAKHASDMFADGVPPADITSAAYVYSGTLIVQGSGRGEVTETGVRSALGKIGKSLADIDDAETPTQRETRHVVRNVAIAGLLLACVFGIVYWLMSDDWLSGILAGLTLTMAVVPEEFPVVLMLFLSLGAWRLSQNKVLARNIPAIERLGATTVLCVDKTGTLTANRMALRRICSEDADYDAAGGDSGPLPESLHEVMEFAVLASHRHAFDPMEMAIAETGKKLLSNTEHLHADWTLVDDYPLGQEMMAMSRVWQSPDFQEFMIAAKGAPEAIVDLCHMDAVRAARIGEQVGVMAQNGLRVLGVAKAVFPADVLPMKQHDFDFVFLGLVAFSDPVRADVPQAIAACHAAGIRVLMLTGDHPATALAIAKEVGLSDGEEVMLGSEIAVLDDRTLRQRLSVTSVFCRIQPEQKLRLVEALRAQGEVVAMTGDGINDAPALKAADIGVAMGGRGTDVAREAADLVLLNDDFSSIVTAVRHGRRVFGNLRKVIAFVVVVHVPIVGLSIAPILLGWPLLLMPAHILFLQLIHGPVCSIVFEAEPEEPDVMATKPRAVDQHLFDASLLRLGLWQGGGLLALLLAITGGLHYAGNPPEMIRAEVFCILVLSNLGLVYINRSAGPTSWRSSIANPYLGWSLAVILLLLGVLFFIPAIRQLFSFSPLSMTMLSGGLAAAALSCLWFEMVKRRRFASVPQAL